MSRCRRTDHHVTDHHVTELHELPSIVVQCPVQSSCGGCPQLHRPRVDEHEQKRWQVHQALVSHGIELDQPEMVAGQNRHFYRNRFRLRVDDGIPQLFNPAKAGGCLALRPKVWDGVAHLRAVAPQVRHLVRHIDHLEVRVSDDDAILGMSWATRSSAHDISDELVNCLGPQWRVSMRNAPNQSTLRYYPADAVSMDVPLDGFVQVNSEVNRLVVDAVRRAVWEVADNLSLATTGRNVLDLFAGAGNFSLPLACDGWSVTAIERSSSSVATLAACQRTDAIRTAVGNVAEVLGECQPADVVVCNPPRAGLRQGYRQVADLARHRLIYIGCDFDRMAVDVSRLAGFGLRPVQATVFDMFPGTNHVETMVVMDRAGEVSASDPFRPPPD